MQKFWILCLIKKLNLFRVRLLCSFGSGVGLGKIQKEWEHTNSTLKSEENHFLLWKNTKFWIWIAHGIPRDSLRGASKRRSWDSRRWRSFFTTSLLLLPFFFSSSPVPHYFAFAVVSVWFCLKFETQILTRKMEKKKRKKNLIYMMICICVYRVLTMSINGTSNYSSMIEVGHTFLWCLYAINFFPSRFRKWLFWEFKEMKLEL